MAEFINVARIDEIPPGERLVVEIRRRWVAIFNVDGQFFAIEDRCTHDDGPLAEGELLGCEIICPRHGARFDIRDGKVMSAPALVDVPSYEIRVLGENVQIKSG